MRFFCIGDEDVVTGFRFAGIRGRIVTDEGGAKEAFEDAIHSEDIGILIVTEKVAAMLEDEILNWQQANDYPLIVDIPDLGGHIAKRKTLMDAIREAVGIHLE